MPVYNASLFLKEAIESILNQNYSNFEFIIINDGSTDNSLDIIKSFNDPRIIIVNNEKNLGIIKTRNIGLKMAKGKYIANMDADDISLPNRLEKQVAYLDSHPDTAIIASRLVLINDLNKEIGVWQEDVRTNTYEDILTTLPVINCVGQPTIMMRADVVKRIGYFEGFMHNEDWGLWLHVLSLGYKIEKLPETLLRYRQHSAGTTITANKLGVEKKIISFKYRYLKHKILSFKFRYTDKKVLSSFIKNIFGFTLKKIFPKIHYYITRLIELKRAKFLQQFFKVKKQLNGIKDQVPVIYFFPSFHTGGADRVHASILEAVNKRNSITFITSRSDNAAFYDKFSRYSNVIEVNEIIKVEKAKQWLVKRINDIVKKNASLKMFGCNSLFFYELIPFLPKNVFCVDLIHAFVHIDEDGPEKWSLSLVDRINKRIVINQKTKNDFIELYRSHQISSSYVSNIEVIQNFVEPKELWNQKNQDIIKVVYVGRGSEEKRVDLIAELASRIRKENKLIEFHFIGNVRSAIPAELQDFCVFHNEINNDIKLQELYDLFHIIIIASTREGFPMVIMEAMMNGVVPVSTNVGGISEHIIDNENGFLINSKERNEIIIEFKQKINYLFEHKDKLEQISKKSHAYALKHFNKDVFFKSYAKLLS